MQAVVLGMLVLFGLVRLDGWWSFDETMLANGTESGYVWALDGNGGPPPGK